MTDENFDPEKHKLFDSNYFEDLEIGQKFYIPSRTMTDALFSAFQLASGDNHPIHYDIGIANAVAIADWLRTVSKH